MQQNYIKYNTETPPKSTPSFTGKERDSETGLSYFGARYYDSDILTGWLSVDPMADKYPGLSPYSYCAWTRPTGADEHRLIEFNIANNPVKLVDPDGRMIVPNDDGWIVNHDEKSVTKITDNGGNYTQIEYNNNGEIINTSFSSIDDFTYQYENMGYTVNRGEKQSESSIGIDVENETSLSGNAPIGMGIAAELIDKLGNTIYNKKNGTWIGKDGKVRSMSWGGNQYTGGKNKFAKVTSQRLKVGGKLLGFSSQIITAANIEMDYRSGNLTQFGRILEHGINIGSSIPLYGTVFSVFYELGKEHGPSTWF
jgi:RHS repeat-associated protein